MTLRDHRIPAISADIAVGRLEFTLNRNYRDLLVADFIKVGYDAKHRLTHSSVNCRGCPPDHASRSCAANIHYVQHPRIYSEHFAGAGRIEHARICEGHSDQESINIVLFKACVAERYGRQLPHQL